VSKWGDKPCRPCKPVCRVMARTLFSRTTIGVCRGRRDLNSLRLPWRHWELHRGQAERCGAVISTAIERKRTLCGESPTEAETHSMRTIFTANGIQRRSQSRVRLGQRRMTIEMYKCAPDIAQPPQGVLSIPDLRGRTLRRGSSKPEECSSITTGQRNLNCLFFRLPTNQRNEVKRWTRVATRSVDFVSREGSHQRPTAGVDTRAVSMEGFTSIGCR
jgi:hypothetical protein